MVRELVGFYITGASGLVRVGHVQRNASGCLPAVSVMPLSFKADSVYDERFPFTPHSICPVFAENRRVFEAISRSPTNPQILMYGFPGVASIRMSAVSMFTTGMSRQNPNSQSKRGSPYVAYPLRVVGGLLTICAAKITCR